MTPLFPGGIFAGMSFLLPQTRRATVRGVRPVDIHGDRYVDLTLELDDEAGRTLVARVSSSEAPQGLKTDDRVEARFVAGVVVGIQQAES